MRSKMLLPSKRLRTYLASMRRVARVLLQMVREMLLTGKRLLAVLAPMRGFARVYSIYKKNTL